MFSKITAPATQRLASSNRNVSGATFSVLGADLTIKGDLTASADLHIDGRVEGDVACANLVQGESSEVVGNITADTARLSGTVHGSIQARELVILRSARIHGDVHYEALTIEQGAQVEGRFAPRGTPVMLEPAMPDTSEPLLVLAG
jgi:cytoskeletal protein CcmA (bactofilin family)